jgi:cyanophycinase
MVRGERENNMGSVFTQRGYLYLIGGAEDRKGEKHVLKHLLDQTHAANIIIIPTASGYPRDIDRCYTDTFKSLGVKNIKCLDIRYRDEADGEENIQAIEKADLIYFGGGDQVKLVDTLIRTKLFDRMKARFEAGALHIAGTSAGASAAGNPIFYNGDRKGFQKGSIKVSEGFGLIDGVAIDTHFSVRNRLSRLCQFLISGRCKKGIGLDEDTGLVVYPNLHCKVIGSGMVTIVNSAKVSGSNYAAAADGERLRFNNMRVGFLPAGTTFSIKKWSILNRVEHDRNNGNSAMRSVRR